MPKDEWRREDLRCASHDRDMYGTTADGQPRRGLRSSDSDGTHRDYPRKDHGDQSRSETTLADGVGEKPSARALELSDLAAIHPIFDPDDNDWLPETSESLALAVLFMESHTSGQASGALPLERLRSIYSRLGGDADLVFTADLVQRLRNYKKHLPR